MDMKEQKSLATMLKAVYGNSLDNIHCLNKKAYAENKGELKSKFESVDNCVFNILLEASLRHKNAKYYFNSDKDMLDKFEQQKNKLLAVIVSIYDEHSKPVADYIVDVFGNITNVNKYKQKDDCQSQL